MDNSPKDSKITLSIVLPCLNEAETLLTCITNAKNSLESNRISGEVIVADNGSTDGSQEIAVSAGARVVHVEKKGYGAALKSGIEMSRGSLVIMADSDDSYALESLEPFIAALRSGCDLVVGNRFSGGISPGAMPILHRYLGNPVLSWIGRVFYKVPLNDFHCGLRGFQRQAILNLNLTSTGMEFASEMIVKAALQGLKIQEVPTTLRPAGRSRKPHLRTWRDGWRHLTFLLAASPRWLFLYPGLLLVLIGTIFFSVTASGPRYLGSVRLDLNTYFLSIALILVGIQIILLAILARVFFFYHGFLPKSPNVSRFESYFSLERGVLLGAFLILLSFSFLFFQLILWTRAGFASLDVASSLRISGLIVLMLSAGIQILFASFFASILQV